MQSVQPGSAGSTTEGIQPLLAWLISHFAKPNEPHFNSSHSQCSVRLKASRSSSVQSALEVKLCCCHWDKDCRLSSFHKIIPWAKPRVTQAKMIIMAVTSQWQMCATEEGMCTFGKRGKAVLWKWSWQDFFFPMTFHFTSCLCWVFKEA